MDPQRPRSVTSASWLVVAVVALSGVTAVCTAAFKSTLVDSWAAGRTDAGSVDPPAFVPVVIVMFVVHALLIGVLTMLFREGHGWARIVLSVVALLTALAAVAGMRTGLPALFVVLSLVEVVLDLALVGCLWHKDTSAFVSRRPVGSGAGTRA